MPRPCSVCSHPARDTIEAALIAPTVNKTQLAKEHGVSRFALIDHAQKHMSKPQQDSHSDEGDMQQSDGCAEAEVIYQEPDQTRRNELLEKAHELNERALRCPGTPAAMITLLRQLTDLTVKLAEKS
jgi:hypothetical protein